MNRHDTKAYYFAYGSNMKVRRLTKRTPSARKVGIGTIVGKCLVCNKQSKDRSGKANLVDGDGDLVWGVLFEVDATDLPRLDQAEGGYERVCLPVTLTGGEVVDAAVYISQDLTDEPVPYDSYKALIVCGAREAGLPDEYVAFLAALPSKPVEG